MRNTKYSQAILKTLKQRGHASNRELIEAAKLSYPEVSATTIHRCTQKLTEAKQISIAPKSYTGSMRFDINTEPHDHFECTKCGVLKDVIIDLKSIRCVDNTLASCKLQGPLLLKGECSECQK